MQKQGNEAQQNELLASGWLSGKPPEFQEALFQGACVLRYGAGRYTHHLGDDPAGFYGIISGSFGALTQNPVVGTVMGHIMQRGEWFGQRPMIIGKPRSLAFRAMEESTVSMFPFRLSRR